MNARGLDASATTAKDVTSGGCGHRLMRRVLDDIHADGLRGVHAVFGPELERFYRSAGFQMLSGGLIDFKHMKWPLEQDGDG